MPQIILRSIGLFGIVLFGLAFFLTFVSPIHYEKAARSFLEYKIEQKLKNRINLKSDSKVAAFAKNLLEKNQQQIKDIKERFLPILRARIASIVANMQTADCECRKRMLQGLAVASTLASTLDISFLEKSEPQLQKLIEGQYGEIVANLLRDLRIFAGSNLVAFSALLLLSFVKSGYIRQLFLPGLLLALACIITSAIYLFGQNWFFTLLYNDFVGTAYIAWLALAYGFLCDIALFKARITSSIVDLFVSSIDAVSPC
jgi:hypothetical protein